MVNVMQQRTTMDYIIIIINHTPSSEDFAS